MFLITFALVFGVSYLVNGTPPNDVVSIEEVGASIEENSTTSETSKDNVISVEKANTAEEYLPDSYWIKVVQVGGFDSNLLSKVALISDEDFHAYIDSDKFVTTSFNSNLSLLWVGCREGYKIVNEKSETNSAIYGVDSIRGIELIADVNKLNIRCKKH